MSDKQRTKRTSQASQPVLAEMLFAAIQEHDAALAGVARVLHDDVSQVLSAVGLQLDAMRMDFKDQAPAIDDRAAEIQTMLEQVIEQLRDISNELNPSVVERAGLQFALDRLAGKVRDNAGRDSSEDGVLSLPRLLLDYYASQGEVALEIEALASGGTVIRASH